MAPVQCSVEQADTRDIFNTCRAAGGNYVDPADIFSGDVSKDHVGHFIGETGSRDAAVLAAKFGSNAPVKPIGRRDRDKLG